MGSDLKVMRIKNSQAHEWCLYKHYARRIPSISHAFGLYASGLLVGIVSYGMPVSPNLCSGVCGEQFATYVLELNRLCIDDNVYKNAASVLVGRSLSKLPQSIIVSYADTAKGHIGYVYQATNFIYTGATKARTDIFSESGHSRHHCGDTSKRQFRSSKHRYVTFVGTKAQKREMRRSLRYPVLPYPKGVSKRYDASYQCNVQGELFL